MLLLEEPIQEPRGSHNICYAIHNILIQVGCADVDEHNLKRLSVILDSFDRSIYALLACPDDHCDVPWMCRRSSAVSISTI
ncbi:hypothetical protein P43SY_011484 [Pythium insidiosum]|uniref:Uncharacterized protein n=1 Tax=Pythium insidiosum TaxID=114742 RepID=A0AAD5L860_PYTIN|nr:hypothetical protein P43SY_011484 [Pythium insidiosum]